MLTRDKKLDHSAHIAVVGAGMAGVACASTLYQAGFCTSLFDKSKGAGGRMSTRRGTDWQCDHGARYFTARHPAFQAEVMRWRQAGVAQMWKPVFGVLGEQQACYPDQNSDKFVGIPTMTAPARFLCKDLKLTAGITIKQIDRRPEGWRLLSAEKGWIDTVFDAVLLALPAPQVMPLLQQCAPELFAVANTAVMQGCWTVMMRFAAPLTLPFNSAMIQKSPLHWLVHNNSKPDRHGEQSWVLQACPQWSQIHIEDDSESVATVLLDEFVRLGGTQPQAWTVHRWRYAYCEQPLNLGCIWTHSNGLGLCGDWLNDGTIEGAWLSGVELAKQICSSELSANSQNPFLGNLNSI